MNDRDWIFGNEGEDGDWTEDQEEEEELDEELIDDEEIVDGEWNQNQVNMEANQGGW